MKIYLSGPITGSKDSEIKSWREIAAEELTKYGEVIDPSSSAYDSEISFQKSETPSEAIKRLRHGINVVKRNKNLIATCDVVFANFQNTKTASIGSVGEMFWADAFGKPIILIREKEGNVHDHAMLNALASSVCLSLEEGYAMIKELAKVRGLGSRIG